jgi:hypothetical protein
MKKSLVLSLVLASALVCGTAEAKHPKKTHKKHDPVAAAQLVPESGATIALLATALLIMAGTRHRLQNRAM